jgi:hypothetical protein
MWGRSLLSIDMSSALTLDQLDGVLANRLKRTVANLWLN